VQTASWRQCTVGDLCDEGLLDIQTGPFGSQLHAYDYILDGVPVVPTEAIRGRRIDHAVLPKISAVKAEELKRHRLLVGDILFARRGVQATGHIAYVKYSEEGYICGTGAIRLRVDGGRNRVLSEYLSHVFANPASIEWFKFNSIGATMPNLNEGIVRRFPLSIPPLAEQVAVSSLLTALDDKIDLNRRMNETLEAMARAIFKDWFVDFGPTRAKMEGRAPYLAPEIWALFPERLDDAGKPEGWSEGTLEKFAVLNPESWSTQTVPSKIRYVDLSGVKWGYIDAVADLAWEAAPSRARRVLRRGDTIVGTVRPGNGSFALVDEDGLTGSTGFAVLRPRVPQDRELIWCTATAPENINRLSHLADGGAYPAVRSDLVAATPITVAAPQILFKFSTVCRPLINRIEANKREARTLAATRDLLLPKLMSGEIRVKDAERIAEAAA